MRNSLLLCVVVQLLGNIHLSSDQSCVFLLASRFEVFSSSIFQGTTKETFLHKTTTEETIEPMGIATREQNLIPINKNQLAIIDVDLLRPVSGALVTFVPSFSLLDSRDHKNKINVASLLLRGTEAS